MSIGKSGMSLADLLGGIPDEEDEYYDIEIEPIMFFPNGTRLKTGELTGNGISEIIKAFIP